MDPSWSGFDAECAMCFNQGSRISKMRTKQTKTQMKCKVNVFQCLPIWQKKTLVKFNQKVCATVTSHKAELCLTEGMGNSKVRTKRTHAAWNCKVFVVKSLPNWQRKRVVKSNQKTVHHIKSQMGVSGEKGRNCMREKQEKWRNFVKNGPFWLKFGLAESCV